MQTEGGFQTAMTLIPVVKGVKSFTRGKTTTVPKTVVEPVKPPAKPTAGSGAKEPGAANPADCKTVCFPAGTKLKTPDGWKAVEDFRAGDRIVSKPENRPEAAATVREVVRF